MVWAAVGVGVVSAGASLYGSIQAGKQADAASAAQQAGTSADLAFQEQQYADWQSVYGPIQDNLSTFYQNLSADSLIASGLQEYGVQFAEQEKNIQRSFAQRGIDSPAQDFITSQAGLTQAENKAAIRNDAPLKLADAQQSFVSGNVRNPGAAGVSRSLQNQASFFGSQANRFAGQQQAGYQAAGTALNGAVDAYLSRPQTPSSPSPTSPRAPTFAPPINQPRPNTTIQV